MAIAFLSDNEYQELDKDSACMMFAVWSTALGEPVDFYFGKQTSFNSYALEWCKKYKRDYPSSRLIYVASEQDSSRVLEVRKATYDLVVYPQLNVMAREGISLRDQYIIEKCETVVIYRDGGIDTYRPAFYAMLRKKHVEDFYLMRNKLFYADGKQNSITAQEVAAFKSDEMSAKDFVRDFLLYLHIHTELMTSCEYFKVYNDAVHYLLQTFNTLKHYTSYNFNRCKQYVIEELELLGKEYKEAGKSPLTPEEFTAFYDFHLKYVNYKPNKECAFEK